MQIWHLGEIEDADIEAGHTARGSDWSAYSDAHGFVIVAETEQQARELAADAAKLHPTLKRGLHWLESSLTFAA
jgi:hypothetical protein